MAKTPKTSSVETEGAVENVNLARFLSTKAVWKGFDLWIVGDSPLICHAWSEKAKRQMLEKQVKSIKPAKEARNPESEFRATLYEMPDGYGFPATAVKKCLLSGAHKDKGVPMTAVQRSLFIEAPYISVRPALAGAICDVPLIRIWGSEPLLREDMVRIGSGKTKTANLAYRSQFTVWGIRVKGRFNASVITSDVLEYLIGETGVATGLGEWRNEKSGSFGAFHLASEEEAKAWNAFASGKGPLPIPVWQRMAAE